MILEAWETEVAEAASATILPDGCQDLLFTALPGEAPQWQITTLDDEPYRINMPMGAYFKGFRMQAGVGFSAAKLLESLRDLPPDHAGVEDRLFAFTSLDPLVEDTLAALQEQAVERGRVAHAAAHLGIHHRKIQRALKHHTGRSAARWLALARVRKAARLRASGAALADTALEAGFSDQPHMTRAFRQWLGTTPKYAPGLWAGYG